MSDNFDARMVATALRLITKRGKTVTITPPPANGAYDPATGSVDGGVPSAPFDCKALVKDFNPRISNAVNLQIETGDKEILIAASGITKPSLLATFQCDDEVFTVVPEREGGLGVKTIYAGELAALYRVHGRHS